MSLFYSLGEKGAGATFLPMTLLIVAVAPLAGRETRGPRSQPALRRGYAGPLAPNGTTQRSADRLEGGLRDVMRIMSARFDVETQPTGLRQTPEHVLRESRVAGERALAPGPPAEIERRPRQRVVHRHDGVAVACDPPPVAERQVEGLAERERRILRRVMGARLEIAGSLENEVESGVKR